MTTAVMPEHWLCAHPTAEPVTLITGETIAAVCTSCLAELPAAWIGCDHQPGAEVTCMNDPRRSYMCRHCYGIYAP